MKEITWQAPEFEYHHKNGSWYLWVAGVAAIVVALALLQGNFLFVVFTVIAAILVIKWGARPPRYLDFSLTESALVIDGKKSYLYEQLEGFATRRLDDLEEGLSQLILHKKHRLGAHLRILFPTRHTEEIRHFLNRHLHEMDHEDSLSDHISRLLRF